MSDIDLSFWDSFSINDTGTDTSLLPEPSIIQEIPDVPTIHPDPPRVKSILITLDLADRPSSWANALTSKYLITSTCTHSSSTLNSMTEEQASNHGIEYYSLTHAVEVLPPLFPERVTFVCTSCLDPAWLSLAQEPFYNLALLDFPSDTLKINSQVIHRPKFGIEKEENTITIDIKSSLFQDFHSDASQLLTKLHQLYNVACFSSIIFDPHARTIADQLKSLTRRPPLLYVPPLDLSAQNIASDTTVTFLDVQVPPYTVAVQWVFPDQKPSSFNAFLLDTLLASIPRDQPVLCALVLESLPFWNTTINKSDFSLVSIGRKFSASTQLQANTISRLLLDPDFPSIDILKAVYYGLLNDPPKREMFTLILTPDDYLFITIGD